MGITSVMETPDPGGGPLLQPARATALAPYYPNPKIVKLNVGGTRYTVGLSTLLAAESSYFDVLFSGRCAHTTAFNTLWTVRRVHGAPAKFGARAPGLRPRAPRARAPHVQPRARTNRSHLAAALRPQVAAVAH
jgi:hypothetical protein